MKQRIVEYHSPQWSELVEQGWITHTIETLPSGVQVAIMVYYPPQRRGWDSIFRRRDDIQA